MLIGALLTAVLLVCARADTTCPDEQRQCDGDQTCCHLAAAAAGSDWGCCPFNNGMCCSDGLTCCPADHQCVPGKRACVPNSSPIEKIGTEGSDILTRKRPLGGQAGVHHFEMPGSRETPAKALEQSKNSANAGCSAVETSCSSNMCCPLPDAVCCANGIHCCPSLTSCDLSVARCVAGSGQSQILLPLYTQFQSKSKQQKDKVEVKDVVCPDQQSSCPDGTTCCILASGQYGCCPSPNAVCCDDHEHCCPQNTKCDVAHSRCIRADGAALDWYTKQAAKKVEVKDVVCPDKQSSCPDGTTCCLLDSGNYGCCPLPNAVCCEDKTHCCPQNTKCDVAHSRCMQSDGEALDWYTKTSAKKVEVKSVVCPDQQSTCPDGTTCCQVSGGGFGCCPLPNAVCCSDQEHCCPENTTCDLEHSRCKQGDGATLDWYTKSLAKKVEVKDVVCPDKQSSCSEGTTCCQLDSGDYGCCPYANAVCCDDKEHCCPENTVCDLKQSRCVSSAGMYVSLSKKMSPSKGF